MSLVPNHMPSTIDGIRTQIENIMEIRKSFVTIKRQSYDISIMKNEDFAIVKTFLEIGDVASPSFVMKVPFYNEFEMYITSPECIFDAAEFLATGSTHDRDNGYR